MRGKPSKQSGLSVLDVVIVLVVVAVLLLVSVREFVHFEGRSTPPRPTIPAAAGAPAAPEA